MREDSSLNQLTSQSLHLVNPARYSDAHAGQNIFTSVVAGNLRGSVDCLRAFVVIGACSAQTCFLHRRGRRRRDTPGGMHCRRSSDQA